MLATKLSFAIDDRSSHSAAEFSVFRAGKMHDSTFWIHSWSEEIAILVNKLRLVERTFLHKLRWLVQHQLFLGRLMIMRPVPRQDAIVQSICSRLAVASTI